MSTSMARVAAAGLFSLSLCSVAEAAPILDLSPGGILLGARNVLVDGSLYNVTFEKGSCESLYDGCTDEAITFSSMDAAAAAAQALLDQVFVDGPSGNFDSQTDIIFGCVWDQNCLSRIVYDHGDPSLSPQIVVVNWAAPWNDYDGWWNETLLATDDSNWTNVNFATFTPVPEPGTLVLLALGLGGLGARSRRKRPPSR